MFDLRFPTPAAWLDAVFGDFDTFLLDHAACERKASATGMAFVARYPDRHAIIEPLLEFSREELEHFQIVYRLVRERGLTLVDDSKDLYVNAMRARCRTGGDALLLDRLVVAGVVEARGCERLFMVAGALETRDPALHPIYLDLARSESRHHGLFFRLARCLFSESEVEQRASEFLDFEAELVRRLPLRAAVH